MAKYLDQAGLQILWNATKAKFIDNDELALFLTDYEKIEDLQRDYANRTELATILSGYATDEELAAAIAGLANTYVKKQVDGTNGTAYIFNETDGGGAKFVHNDGLESFVGVNDGGEDGLAAQIYADKYVDGKWQGAKLDVTNGGIYYTVGNKSFAERAVEDNELVVKKDIAGLVGGMHFIGATTLATGETYAEAIARLLQEKGHTAAGGDIVIIKSSDSDKEFIYDGSVWVELGDQGIYATKAQLEAEAETRSDADTTLQANIDNEETRAMGVEANKLNILPNVDDPTDPGYGYPYHIPYDIGVAADASKIALTVKTLTLDNNLTKMNFNKELPGATASTAGLMAAADKTKLDDITALTQAEIEEICK